LKQIPAILLQIFATELRKSAIVYNIDMYLIAEICKSFADI